MKKYLTRTIAVPTITEIEVERESDSYVWIKGRRNKKRANYESYFDSFDEAKGFLILEADKRVKDARRKYDYAREQLEKAESVELT